MAPHARGDRPRRSALAAALAALAMVLAPASPGYADPDPTAVQAQIDTAWNALEPLVEQYDGVHAELQANQARSAALAAQLQPLQLQVDMAAVRLSDIAVQAYKGGTTSTLNVLLAGGSPSQLAEQLAMLNAMAHDKRVRIGEVTAARDKYAADKKAVDDLIATQRRQDADLAAKKTQIERRLADLQTLRQQAAAPPPALTTSRLKPAACPVADASGPGGAAAMRACDLIGKPYIWAAAGPGGYDCSGLTLAAWAAAGVSLAHQTRAQWGATTPVGPADLRPGDLVFFYQDLHHVGIYVGDGWMVHAPQSGDVVRMARIDSRYLPPVGFRRPG